MKPLLVFSISVLLLAVPGLAQRRGGVTFVGVGGFGNVLYPGTGGPGTLFPSRLGATVAGNPFPTRGIGRSTGFIGGYPIYTGGAYVPAYAPDYSSQTQFAPQQQQQYPPAPPVIINQYFGPPAPEPTSGAYQPSGVYQPSSERPQAAAQDVAPPQNRYYLLAFKDHSVYSALAYWVEDKTLHYVTPQNTHNQASLDLVDMEFTKQLNQDREVPFSLTPSPAH
jgi:hypothetical protein